jgi:hypothetical protein
MTCGLSILDVIVSILDLTTLKQGRKVVDTIPFRAVMDYCD